MRVLLIGRDNGDWINLFPIAKGLRQVGVEAGFAVEPNSVCAQKFHSADFHGIVTMNPEYALWWKPDLIITGMSSLLGRYIVQKAQIPCLGVCSLPREYFSDWADTPLDMIFVSTEAEKKVINQIWGGKTLAVQTGYPFLDSFAEAAKEINKKEIRERLGLYKKDKLIWIAGDNQGLKEFFEMALGAISDLKDDSIVVLTSFHSSVDVWEMADVETVTKKYSNLRYVDPSQFPRYESQFVADVLISSVCSSMPIQSAAMGGTSVGTTLPIDMIKQRHMIGSDRVEDGPFVAGKLISHAGDTHTLHEVLRSHLDDTVELNPFPAFDQYATKRIVEKVLEYKIKD